VKWGKANWSKFVERLKKSFMEPMPELLPLDYNQYIELSKYNLQLHRDHIKVLQDKITTLKAMQRQMLELPPEKRIWCQGCNLPYLEKVKTEDALADRLRLLELVAEASKELLEVAILRGDNILPPPEVDEEPWTVRMQLAWNELRNTLEELERS
jgi:hypothetical protein